LAYSLGVFWEKRPANALGCPLLRSRRRNGILAGFSVVGDDPVLRVKTCTDFSQKHFPENTFLAFETFSENTFLRLKIFRKMFSRSKKNIPGFFFAMNFFTATICYIQK